MAAPDKKTALLTHRGRTSGKEFITQVWYVDVGGQTWIGSRDGSRNWVRNVVAAGRLQLDTGAGPCDFLAVSVEDEQGRQQFQTAILRKYPIAARILALTVRAKNVTVFRLDSCA
ncbi:MAG: deazaflavin-dependent oxidoreductase (nitroreductase family) [Hyphomicrobiaceae bacterium]|jgi:deazaflavin-dependent oxidoreductase (nitroreductase family)